MCYKDIIKNTLKFPSITFSSINKGNHCLLILLAFYVLISLERHTGREGKREKKKQEREVERKREGEKVSDLLIV